MNRTLVQIQAADCEWTAGRVSSIRVMRPAYSGGVSVEPMSEIGREEFVRRLGELCTGGGSGLPRKRRDLHILLASATLWMETGTIYTESEINAGLQTWIADVGAVLGLDHVTIRRELIDSSYLLRDDAGNNYSPGPGPAFVRFGPGIADVAPAEVLAEARAVREARKAAHTNRQ